MLLCSGVLSLRPLFRPRESQRRPSLYASKSIVRLRVETQLPRNRDSRLFRQRSVTFAEGISARSEAYAPAVVGIISQGNCSISEHAIAASDLLQHFLRLESAPFLWRTRGISPAAGPSRENQKPWQLSQTPFTRPSRRPASLSVLSGSYADLARFFPKASGEIRRTVALALLGAA